MKFRKKPVVVEAVQWTGDNSSDIRKQFGRGNFDVLTEADRANCDDPEATAAVFDSTHGTWLLVTPGQWIIKGVQAELYPCSDGIFRETYEAYEADCDSTGR